MSRSQKRKIVVNATEYYWVLDGNTIDGFNDTHIRVHKEGDTGKILYIDPYDWHFEIRPKFVALAIQFALTSGWLSNESTEPIYVGYIDGKYCVLPKGIKFGYQLMNKK